MNRTAMAKYEIYNKLIGFREHDLIAIADFVDFLRQKKQVESKKTIRLEGILKGYDLDCADLKTFRKQTWNHVEQESANE